jgi:hypothetical protein
MAQPRWQLISSSAGERMQDGGEGVVCGPGLSWLLSPHDKKNKNKVLLQIKFTNLDYILKSRSRKIFSINR